MLAGVLSAAAGCEPRPRDVDPSLQTVEPSSRIDEERELAATCPSPLEACGASLTPSCRLSCQPTLDGCADVWELYRLDAVPAGYRGDWLGFDAEGNHGVFAAYPVPDPNCRYPGSCPENQTDDAATLYSSWSSTDGVAPFPFVGSGEAGLSIDRVSDDGSVVFGRSGLDGIYWTSAGGVQPVPLNSASMARNGRLFAGWTQAGGARWSPGSGVDVVATGTTFRSTVAEGDAALFVTSSSITYSSGLGAQTVIGLPSDVDSPASFREVAMAAGGVGFAATIETADGDRLYRWSDGVFERIDLPVYEPGFWWIERLRISDDGRVVVADVGHGLAQLEIVRWTRETGTRVLSEARTMSTEYVSASGDVIFGRAVGDDGRQQVMRWSLEEGMVATSAALAARRVALDGDVLVDMDDDGVLLRKYGRAVDVPLPLDHLRGRFVATRLFWPSLLTVSPDARVLGGVALDDPGNAWLWVARLQTLCPNASSAAPGMDE